MSTSAKIELSNNLLQIMSFLPAQPSSNLLKSTVHIATASTINLPPYITNSSHECYDTLEILLDDLYNIIKKLYNKEGQIIVIAPNLLLAHKCYDKLAQEHLGWLYKRSGGMYEKIESAKAVILPTEQDAMKIIPQTVSACLVICPGRFQTIQLKWLEESLASGSDIILLNPDIDDLSASIKRNDHNSLEFLLARWEIEHIPEEKNKHLMTIINYLEAIKDWM